MARFVWLWLQRKDLRPSIQRGSITANMGNAKFPPTELLNGAGPAMMRLAIFPGCPSERSEAQTVVNVVKFLHLNVGLRLNPEPLSQVQPCLSQPGP